MIFSYICTVQQELSPLQQRNQAFRDFLSTLNPAQRRAVDQTEGPVLVIAGPGAGKTQLLTARIGKILLDTDAKAHNVLCLTFTDAGANAMRQRLLQRIGPEAWRVPIFTFHAFCNRVIQDNLEYFGKKQLEAVSELERIEMVRQLLSKLPPEHPLRAGKKDIFLYEYHLRDLFSNMKKQDWTPGLVRRHAEQFVAEMPQNQSFVYQRNTKEYKKGALKKPLVEAWTEKMERLKAAADLFPKYVNSMERAGRYEYEDMVLWVIKAFEKNKALLQTYQERFQYVLVDEFQDTNGAQFHLLNLLLEYWDVPNVFIVGDDDQSIYEFQGARLENLRAFYEKYRKGLEIIVLDQNYRSSQAILDAASDLIQANEIRAVRAIDVPLEKRLLAAKDDFPSRALEVHAYQNRVQETAAVLGRIEALLAEGVPADEIAVLYAKHAQVADLQSLLEKKRIPYHSKRPVNVLDTALVRQLRDLLCYLHDEVQKPFSGEHRLFRILHQAHFGLPALDLAKMAFALRMEQGQRDASLYEKIGNRANSTRFWRETLGDRPWMEGLGLEKPEALYTLHARLNQWVADLQNLPLAPFIERLYSQTGLLAYVLGHPDRVQLLQVMASFLEFVKQEAERNPRFSPARLLDLLDSMDDNKVILPLQSALREGPGVQLLTAHAAKGLEFGYVFLMGCTEDAWEKNKGGNRGRFALPPTLTFSGEEDALEARRRLFYVAMTRAKHHLYISYPQHDAQGKNTIKTRFVTEIDLPEQAAQLPSEDLLGVQTLLMAEPDAPVISLPETALVDGLLADFRLSISALNRYLRCPLAFYYEDLLRVPGASSEAAAYGLAMHGTLQHFLLRMKADKKQQWPSVEVLHRLFAQEMDGQRGYFSENGYVQRLALGRENLRRIHVEQVPYWRKRAVAERRVDRVEFEGIPLTGVLDKIEWLDNGTLRVVDYKTGQPDPKKTAPPDDGNALGGDYWRQLAFYVILMDAARIYPENVSKTAISWLDPDKAGAYPITEVQFTGDQIRWVGGLVQDTWQRIQSRQFDTGCGKPDCAWCQMHRDRTLREMFPREEEQGLDDGD